MADSVQSFSGPVYQTQMMLKDANDAFFVKINRPFSPDPDAQMLYLYLPISFTLVANLLFLATARYIKLNRLVSKYHLFYVEL